MTVASSGFFIAFLQRYQHLDLVQEVLLFEFAPARLYDLRGRRRGKRRISDQSGEDGEYRRYEFVHLSPQRLKN